MVVRPRDFFKTAAGCSLYGTQFSCYPGSPSTMHLHGLKLPFPCSQRLDSNFIAQVSVERLFSGLKFILDDLRARLSGKSVEDIMFLRVNN